jgi:hypothetical protein
MRRVPPEGYEAKDTIHTAHHIGHKLHIDQNEKLIRYGSNHILVIDGFSSRKIYFTKMPRKNNLLIYTEIMWVSYFHQS